jgi:tRNA 2-selenouridine synthase
MAHGSNPALQGSMFNFSDYDLLIDARSPREYLEDHIPGAVNLPVVDDGEYAQVGTLHRTDKHRAYVIGVAHSLRNMANAIDEYVAHLPKSARILVYCFRGGKRSRLWFDVLNTIGFKVERLEGGWKRYRRWVIDQLDVLPGRFSFRILCGATGVGKTRLLEALQQAGGQVLDLEALACHRGSILGAIPGQAQPSQKWFESLLLQELMRFDLARPVWAEAESRKIGARSLPEGMINALRAGVCHAVEAPMPERVKLWREDYRHFEERPEDLVDKLRGLIPLVGHEEFERWEALARARETPALFERLMVAHYDPAYERSSRRNFAHLAVAGTIPLASLEADALACAARQLLEHENAVASARVLPIAKDLPAA